MFQESSLHTDALKYAKYLTQFQVELKRSRSRCFRLLTR